MKGRKREGDDKARMTVGNDTKGNRVENDIGEETERENLKLCDRESERA